MTTRSQQGIIKLNPKYTRNLSALTTSISPLLKNLMSALYESNWKNAMSDEYNALIQNKTLELVPYPLNVDIIQSM